MGMTKDVSSFIVNIVTSIYSSTMVAIADFAHVVERGTLINGL